MLSQEMLGPTLFEIRVYLRAFMFVEKCVQKMLVTTLPIYNTGMNVTYAVKFLMMGSNAYMQADDVRSYQNGL